MAEKNIDVAAARQASAETGAPAGRRSATPAGNPTPSPAAAPASGAQSSSVPAVELRDVYFSYGGRRILDGVSMRFGHGQVSALVGPNGCGKSTTVRLISNALSPDAGTVSVGGKATTAMPRKELARRVAVLAQGTETPDMLVEHLVMSGRYPHRAALAAPTAHDHEVVNAAMERAGCQGFAGENMRNLSGGERQRVYLALVLAQQTDVVVMDEPTTYLDASACFDLMDLARDLAGEGKAVIMVLHDLNLALARCDRVAVLAGGHVRAFGEPSQIAAGGSLQEVFGVRLASVHDDATDRDWWCLLPR